MLSARNPCCWGRITEAVLFSILPPIGIVVEQAPEQPARM
ncbi:hypothetical protein ApDm4_0643 [Acetobacter pomorum]|nr:hypothetical protein ApDm4_0643 [Acetobacter pomorum]